jgi:hypothetical protein
MRVVHIMFSSYSYETLPPFVYLICGFPAWRSKRERDSWCEQASSDEVATRYRGYHALSRDQVTSDPSKSTCMACLVAASNGV